MYVIFLKVPVFLTPPAAFNASIIDELFPTRILPGLFTWPYTNTENSWPDATVNFTFILLYFWEANLFASFSTSLIVLFSAFTRPTPWMNIEPLESTSVFVVGFNKFARSEERR